MFKIKVNNQKLFVETRESLVSGSMNIYRCLFEFDERWDGVAKTAVFRANNISKPVVLDSNNECIIPPEVLINPGHVLYVGIYGVKGETIVMPTIEMRLDIIQTGAKLDDSSAQIVPSMAAYLIRAIGDLSDLATADKESLVSAVNELLSYGVVDVSINADGKLCLVMADGDSVICDALPTSGGKLTGSIITRDVRVGGDIDPETGSWSPSAGKGKSSLRVSGTTELLGELKGYPHAHLSEIDCSGTAEIGGSVKIYGPTEIYNSLEASGSVRFRNEGRIDHSWRVGSELRVDGQTKLYGTLDMKGNDIKSVQSIKVNGTSELLGDVKIRPNTNRDYKYKLSDAINEALDGTFKNRIVVTDMDGATFAEQLQAAVDMCPEGGTVFIPKSDTGYILDKAVVVNNAKSIAIIGDTNKPTIYLQNITYTIKHNAANRPESISFSNLTLVFENTKYLYWGNAWNITVANCNVLSTDESTIDCEALVEPTQGADVFISDVVATEAKMKALVTTQENSQNSSIYIKNSRVKISLGGLIYSNARDSLKRKLILLSIQNSDITVAEMSNVNVGLVNIIDSAIYSYNGQSVILLNRISQLSATGTVWSNVTPAETINSGVYCGDYANYKYHIAGVISYGDVTPINDTFSAIPIKNNDGKKRYILVGSSVDALTELVGLIQQTALASITEMEAVSLEEPSEAETEVVADSTDTVAESEQSVY